MTGAMYAAIGGLKTHMTNLNVIGNNIANVNTTAYKAQRMIFQETLYTTRRAGSNGTAVRGGNTPSQIGYGAQVGSIDLNMSPGTFNPTGFGLDCMIDGDGFFMVGDKDMVLDDGDNLNRAKLTRAGDFDIDALGYITDGQGNVVFGFQMVYNPNYNPNPSTADLQAAKAAGINIEDRLILSTHLVPLRVPLAAVEPTLENGGIDPTSLEHRWEAGDPVYDILGACIDGTTERKNLSLANLDYYDPDTGALDVENAAFPQGAGSVDGMADSPFDPTGIPLPNLNGKTAQAMSMSINENGAIISTADNGDVMIIGYIAIGQVTAPNGVTHTGGPYYKAQEGAGELTVGIAGGMFPAGTYLNNARMPGEDDAEGLEEPPLKNLLGQMKSIKVIGSGLEASTADVATEFANMIVTQRGYQANTRIVTVTDSMLEELVNMKR